MVMFMRTMKALASLALVFSLIKGTLGLPDEPTIAEGNEILLAQDTDHACFYAYREENMRINEAAGLENSLDSIAESINAERHDDRWESARFDCYETREYMPEHEDKRNAGPWYMTCHGNKKIVPVERRTTNGGYPRVAAICVDPEVKDSMLIRPGLADCRQVAASPEYGSQWASIIGYLTAAEEEDAMQAALLSIISDDGYINYSQKDVSTLEIPRVSTRKGYRVCANAQPGHGNVRLHAGFFSI